MLQQCVCRDSEHLGSLGEHERGVRAARGAAESNSSLLSALQTSQPLSGPLSNSSLTRFNPFELHAYWLLLTHIIICFQSFIFRRVLNCLSISACFINHFPFQCFHLVHPRFFCKPYFESKNIISNDHEMCELRIFFYTETCQSIYRHPTPKGEQGRVFQTVV